MPASRVNPAMPAALEDLLAAMLEKEPRRRPTAAEVAERLTALGSKLAPAAPVPMARRARQTMVGREAERRALVAAFEAVSQGRGLFVGLAGEAGIGKTTLAEEFVVDLAARGAARTVARGRCSERLAGTASCPIPP